MPPPRSYTATRTPVYTEFDQTIPGNWSMPDSTLLLDGAYELEFSATEPNDSYHSANIEPTGIENMLEALSDIAGPFMNMLFGVLRGVESGVPGGAFLGAGGSAVLQMSRKDHKKYRPVDNGASSSVVATLPPEKKWPELWARLFDMKPNELADLLRSKKIPWDHEILKELALSKRNDPRYGEVLNYFRLIGYKSEHSTARMMEGHKGNLSIHNVAPELYLTTDLYGLLMDIMMGDADPALKEYALSIAADTITYGDQNNCERVIREGLKSSNPNVLWRSLEIVIAKLPHMRDEAIRDVSSRLAFGDGGPVPQFGIKRYVFGTEEERFLVYRILSGISFQDIPATFLPLSAIQPIHSLIDHNPDAGIREPVSEKRYNELKVLVEKYGRGNKEKIVKEFLTGSNGVGMPTAVEFHSGNRLVMQAHHRLAALYRAVSEGLVPKEWLDNIPVIVVRYAGSMPEGLVIQALTHNVNLAWEDLLPSRSVQISGDEEDDDGNVSEGGKPKVVRMDRTGYERDEDGDTYDYLPPIPAEKAVTWSFGKVNSFGLLGRPGPVMIYKRTVGFTSDPDPLRIGRELKSMFYSMDGGVAKVFSMLPSLGEVVPMGTGTKYLLEFRPLSGFKGWDMVSAVVMKDDRRIIDVKLSDDKKNVVASFYNDDGATRVRKFPINPGRAALEPSDAKTPKKKEDKPKLTKDDIRNALEELVVFKFEGEEWDKKLAILVHKLKWLEHNAAFSRLTRALMVYRIESFAVRNGTSAGKLDEMFVEIRDAYVQLLGDREFREYAGGFGVSLSSDVVAGVAMVSQGSGPALAGTPKLPSAQRFVQVPESPSGPSSSNERTLEPRLRERLSSELNAIVPDAFRTPEVMALLETNITAHAMRGDAYQQRLERLLTNLAAYRRIIETVAGVFVPRLSLTREQRIDIFRTTLQDTIKEGSSESGKFKQASFLSEFAAKLAFSRIMAVKHIKEYKDIEGAISTESAAGILALSYGTNAEDIKNKAAVPGVGNGGRDLLIMTALVSMDKFKNLSRLVDTHFEVMRSRLNMAKKAVEAYRDKAGFKVNDPGAKAVAAMEGIARSIGVFNVMPDAIVHAAGREVLEDVDISSVPIEGLKGFLKLYYGHRGQSIDIDKELVEGLPDGVPDEWKRSVLVSMIKDLDSVETWTVAKNHIEHKKDTLLRAVHHVMSGTSGQPSVILVEETAKYVASIADEARSRKMFTREDEAIVRTRIAERMGEDASEMSGPVFIKFERLEGILRPETVRATSTALTMAVPERFRTDRMLRMLELAAEDHVIGIKSQFRGNKLKALESFIVTYRTILNAIDSAVEALGLSEDEMIAIVENTIRGVLLEAKMPTGRHKGAEEIAAEAVKNMVSRWIKDSGYYFTQELEAGIKFDDMVKVLSLAYRTTSDNINSLIADVQGDETKGYVLARMLMDVDGYRGFNEMERHVGSIKWRLSTAVAYSGMYREALDLYDVDDGTVAIKAARDLEHVGHGIKEETISHVVGKKVLEMAGEMVLTNRQLKDFLQVYYDTSRAHDFNIDDAFSALPEGSDAFENDVLWHLINMLGTYPRWSTAKIYIEGRISTFLRRTGR